MTEQLTYQTAPSVEFIAPKSKLESKLAPSVEQPPGTAVTQMMDDLAEIGEYHEWWWAANGIAFAVTVEGDVYLEMRLLPLRYDSLDARVETKYVTSQIDGQPATMAVTTCDWTGTREIPHAKRWLRMDPIVKALGLDLAPTGMPSKALSRQPEDMIKLLCQDGPLCDPHVLADVGRLNQVVWSEAFRQKMSTHVAQSLNPYISTLGKGSDEKKAGDELKKKARKHSDKWRKAMEDAQAIMAGEFEPENEPDEDNDHIALAYAVFGDLKNERITEDDAASALDSQLNTLKLREVATALGTTQGGTKGDLIARLIERAKTD